MVKSSLFLKPKSITITMAKMYLSSETTMAQEEALKKLNALKIRLNLSPLLYRRADELDWPIHQRHWYMTNFSHEQMMGNLQNCVELIDELVVLLTDKPDGFADVLGGKNDNS
jgi:hypothetical protein